MSRGFHCVAAGRSGPTRSWLRQREAEGAIGKVLAVGHDGLTQSPWRNPGGLVDWRKAGVND